VRAKDLYTKENRDHQEYENMNCALTECFLSMVSVEHSQSYYALLIVETNSLFVETFQYFYDLFGDYDEREIEANHDQMKQPWDTQLGFQMLNTRFDDGAAFTVFSRQPITIANILNMIPTVILATGVFQLQYTKWYAMPAGKITIVNAWIWWAKKVQIRLKFSKISGSMGWANEYGQSIVPAGHRNNKLDKVINYFAIMLQEVPAL
jgi:hypothetical protein